MSLALGPFHFLSFSGSLEELASGRSNPESLKDLEARLPQPNSLRRANRPSRMSDQTSVLCAGNQAGPSAQREPVQSRSTRAEPGMMR